MRKGSRVMGKINKYMAWKYFYDKGRRLYAANGSFEAVVYKWLKLCPTFSETVRCAWPSCQWWRCDVWSCYVMLRYVMSVMTGLTPKKTSDSVKHYAIQTWFHNFTAKPGRENSSGIIGRRSEESGMIIVSKRQERERERGRDRQTEGKVEIKRQKREILPSALLTRQVSTA